MRIKDWRIAFGFLLLCGLVECSWGASPSQGSVILPHEDAANEREFQNVYQNINTKPTIYTGAGPPSFAPQKIGDIYVSTTTAKVYISTANATSASWIVVN